MKMSKEIACYRIIRFYQNDRKPRTIKTGLTEAEAQAHCRHEDTRGPGWFDGYDLMKGVKYKENRS
jgi:hypothetical protein